MFLTIWRMIFGRKQQITKKKYFSWVFTERVKKTQKEKNTKKNIILEKWQALKHSIVHLCRLEGIIGHSAPWMGTLYYTIKKRFVYE